MDYFITTRSLEDKLAEMLAEKNLLHVMDKSRYPITLTVTQNQAPDAQMAIFDTTDGRMSSSDSVLRFIFNLDGIEINTNSRLVIDDKFMNKIKNQAKKIHAAFVHAWFATNISALRLNMPDFAEERDAEDAGSFDGFYDDKDTDGDDLPVVELPDTDEADETEDMDIVDDFFTPDAANE